MEHDACAADPKCAEAYPTAKETIDIYDFRQIFTPAPREGFHDPVVSDLPVLALAGMNDTQTNPSAADHVVQYLSNGQAFNFPEAGHGVPLFSQCAVDIGVTFVEHPDETIDGHCIEKLKPDFVVPDKTN